MTGAARLHSPAQTAAIREYVVSEARAIAARIFGEEPALQSATLFVAQYWADDADDEVHFIVVPSQLVDPVMPTNSEQDGAAAWDLANLLREDLRERYSIDHWFDGVVEYGWGPYISAFAAFCPEGASQDDEPPDRHAPYAIFRRGPDGLHTEIVGVMLRPWLDGVAAEHVGEGDEEYWQAVRKQFVDLPE
ncbi:MAG: hypothetical protein KIT72_06090 [Polyangiaceae bacterium]|nr:hypothetical protein [Polyangiaceae bacterium]MCW5789970.1 hypothetical protein [Polyangiaceae bacterium]